MSVPRRCTFSQASVFALGVQGALLGSVPTLALAAPSIQPPVLLERVPPDLPKSIEVPQKGITVVLRVLVTADGHVATSQVLESGGESIDAAAIASVAHWQFRPAERDGTPLASYVKVAVPFSPSPSENAGTALTRPVVSAAKGRSEEKETMPSPTVAVEVKPSSPESASYGEHQPTTEVTVLGWSKPASRGASDYQIHIGELRAIPRSNASDFLKLAPGILLTNEGGDGHAEQVFLRGFDAKEGQDVEFSVGGVPINESGNLHGNGYADTHFIIPELVEGLRVLEGPFDPRQGNFAVAGSADYELGLDRRGVTIKGTLGSFGTHRLLLLWGPEGGTKGTFGGVEIYHTDGFGQNRSAWRGSGIGQYEGRFGTRGHYRITGQGYSSDYHSAGVIREDDYQAGKIGFYDTYDAHQGGASSRFSVAGEVEDEVNDTNYRLLTYAVARNMSIRENFTGYLLDTQEPQQTLHSQRGDLIDLSVDSMTFGSKGSAKTPFYLLGLEQSLELGYSLRYDSVSNLQQRVETATNHPYHTEADIGAHLADLGAYVDLAINPIRFVHLRGGVRVDAFTYDVNDRCAVASVAHPSKTDPPGDQSCLSQQDFGNYREPNQHSTTASGVVLPRATVLLGTYRGFQLSGSYGRGVRSIDPSYITQDVNTPFASINAYEGGVSYARSFEQISVVARSTFFQTHVDRDLVFSQTAGRNILANGTTRTGWVGALRLFGGMFDQSLNVTLVRSTFDDTHLLIPYVPDLVVRSDTALFGELPLKWRRSPVRWVFGSGISYVGHRALPYGERSDTVFTVDTSGTLRWQQFELGLNVTNLLDSHYRLGEYNFPSSFSTVQGTSPTLVPARHFTAGAPRAIFISFAITLGGSNAS